MGVCYLTPKARIASLGLDGHGAVATEFIVAGEVIAAFGGRCVTREELDLLPIEQQARSLQVENDLFLAAGTEPEPADFIRHSCEPNCGMHGNSVLIALRDIAAGETVAYDYAMSDGCDYDEFECTCGSPECRRKVTGHDWMLPELQLRYRGAFSPYLAQRIAVLAGVGAERRAFSY